MSHLSPDVENYPTPVLRVGGPPGTGKTTYLARRIAGVVAEHGPTSVLIASFSGTAAKEMASRFTDGPRPARQMIGTLHSHAYRACGHSLSVALDREVIGDWNGQVAPELAITPDMRRASGADTGGSFVSEAENAASGDQLLSSLDRLRASLTPLEDWPANVRDFSGRWEAWKREIGALDFTDMIVGAFERARDGERAPGGPSRLVIDEAQDLTPLEVALTLAWGRNGIERVIFGMDDDQAINRWRGGDPEPLLALAGPEVNDHVLDRSYRVPESVRLAADQWVRRLSHRWDKVYQPRLDPDGNEVLGAAHRVPRRISDPLLVADALREVDQGRTVMIIAACNYMLEPLIRNLRAEGAPFHNPYRPSEARWNPLGRPAEGIITTSQRIRAYLALLERDWTGADIQSWSELVKLRDAGMRANAKRAIAAFQPSAPVPFEEVEGLFADGQMLNQATQPSLDWLSRCLLKGKQGPAEYPIHLARTHGPAALDREPHIVVGTIHSVKGAAADIVYLSPDIAPAAVRSMGTQSGVDETIRQFYVGMTRAYQELRLLAPATRQHVRADELIPSPLEVFAS